MIEKIRQLTKAQKVWGVLFILSAVVLLAILFVGLVASLSSPPFDPAKTLPENDATPAWIATLTTLITLLGLVSSTALTWKREAREAREAKLKSRQMEIELEKTQLELEKLRRELDEEKVV